MRFRIIPFLILLAAIFLSCGDDEVDALNYKFSLNFNSSMGTSCKVDESLNIGIVVDSLNINDATYTTKIYSSFPTKSTILVDNKEVISTDKLNHNYNMDNTLYFKFSAINEGKYTITIEVSNDRHIEKKTIEIDVSQTVFKIDLSCNENEGEVLGSGNYVKEERVIIEAKPKSGYKFDAWYSLGSKISNNNPFTFTASENKTIEARFIKSTYSVKVDYLNSLGTIKGVGDYPAGSSCTLVAEANTYTKFIGFYNDKDVLITKDLSYTFTVNSDIAIKAKFIENLYIDVSVYFDNYENGGCTNNGKVYNSCRVNFETYTTLNGIHKTPFVIKDEFLDITYNLVYHIPFYLTKPFNEWKCESDKNLTRSGTVTIDNGYSKSSPTWYSDKESEKYLKIYIGNLVSINAKCIKETNKDGRNIIINRKVKVNRSPNDNYDYYIN